MEDTTKTTENTETTATQTTATPTAARPSTGAAPRTGGYAPRTGGYRGNSPRKPGETGAAGGARGGFGARRPGGRTGGGRPDRGERPKPEFDQKMLEIRRVTRVVAGGRRFSFSVTLVAGDRKGRVGVGIGKATDTTLAINKAFNDAKRNMIKVKTTETGSIPHDVTAKYNSGEVFLMPNKSRGVVVGSAMRNVIEFAGITDITGRVLSGSKNKLNIARATIKALTHFAMPKAARTE
ncbi:MAG TPA: 30S ribosomal protein S5 [Candidatus Paceibacterota bacterium]|jgi:small subunit ribosomal protein S5|nr:30S ribosomal protein S5 [Candidatus Paceibacterota bacterium]